MDRAGSAVLAKRRRTAGWFVVSLLLALVMLLVLHVGLGKTAIAPGQVLRALLSDGGNDAYRHIIWNLRLPRALVAIAAGLMLGAAGAILQIVMRNPLVEPGLVGASSGAVLLAVIWLIYAPAQLADAVPLPFVALAGGLGAVLLVYALNAGHRHHAARLALIGVLLTAILQSAASLLLLRNQQGLSSIFLWLYGSLNGRGWSSWGAIWPWAAIGLVLSLVFAKRAELLQLGDETSIGLGLAAGRTRVMLLCIAALLTAASVSAVGSIGFIGLMGPHIAALLVGRRPIALFPVSALLAAFLLLAADWIGQSVTVSLSLPGMENRMTTLPAGAVTTLLGAPFFLYLLRKSLVKK
jgi:iron complex transport system permease protein